MFRVRIVVEAPPADGIGAPEPLDLEAPFGPFTGAGATSASFGELEAAMRAAGHLSEALEEALSFEAIRSPVDRAALGWPGSPDPVVAASRSTVVTRPPALPYGGQACEAERVGCAIVATGSMEAPGYGAAGVLLVCDSCRSIVAGEIAAAASGTRCQSPLEAYCPRQAAYVVVLAEGGGRLAVCSPCGERLWAEGSASEPVAATPDEAAGLVPHWA